MGKTPAHKDQDLGFAALQASILAQWHNPRYVVESCY